MIHDYGRFQGKLCFNLYENETIPFLLLPSQYNQIYGRYIEKKYVHDLADFQTTLSFLIKLFNNLYPCCFLFYSTFPSLSEIIFKVNVFIPHHPLCRFLHDTLYSTVIWWSIQWLKFLVINWELLSLYHVYVSSDPLLYYGAYEAEPVSRVHK